METAFLTAASDKREDGFSLCFPLVYYLRVGKKRKIMGLNWSVPNGWKPWKCGNSPFSVWIGSLGRFLGKWECAFSTVHNETLSQLCKPPCFWITALLRHFSDEKRNWYPNCLWLLKCFHINLGLIHSCVLAQHLSWTFRAAWLESNLASVSYPSATNIICCKCCCNGVAFWLQRGMFVSDEWNNSLSTWLDISWVSFVIILINLLRYHGNWVW